MSFYLLYVCRRFLGGRSVWYSALPSSIFNPLCFRVWKPSPPNSAWREAIIRRGDENRKGCIHFIKPGEARDFIIEKEEGVANCSIFVWASAGGNKIETPTFE